ncbi:hypothetical protein [Pseudoxanthomonas suwonensis]|uniref:hypothetical protein n=1 Tax=Pseudoxanthomonas suwonensis TaxID=314722 RepID=UPI000B1C3EFD|nr:hypothetical protein [Pseudoxanthomonas suwonensis]
MKRITFQLRPPASATRSPCDRCRRPSFGGMTCHDCLGKDLADLVQNRGAVLRWEQSLRALVQDERTVLMYAARRSVD